MTATDTIIDSLAVYRLTRLIVDDEITDDLRNRWFEGHDPLDTRLGYVVSCPWCAGMWVAAAAVVARGVAPRLWGAAATVLALSAAAGIIHGHVERI